MDEHPPFLRCWNFDSLICTHKDLRSYKGSTALHIVQFLQQHLMLHFIFAKLIKLEASSLLSQWYRSVFYTRIQLRICFSFSQRKLRNQDCFLLSFFLFFFFFLFFHCQIIHLKYFNSRFKTSKWPPSVASLFIEIGTLSKLWCSESKKYTVCVCVCVCIQITQDNSWL